MCLFSNTVPGAIIPSALGLSIPYEDVLSRAVRMLVVGVDPILRGRRELTKHVTPDVAAKQQIAYILDETGLTMDTAAIDAYRAAEKRLWEHYTMLPTEHVVRIPALNISVRVLEVGSGEPLLFVHGSPNAASKWAPLAANLTDFRCLLLDRPGCGLSEPVEYAGLDLRSFAVELLGGVLDAFSLNRASIVASSLGGALTFYFAHAQPQRIDRLVQAGCPPFLDGSRIPPYNLFWSLMSMCFGSAPSSREAFRHMGHSTSIESGQFESAVLVWRDALMRYTDTARHENRLTANIARRMRDYRYGADLLRGIPAPTLYLWGESDPFGSVEIGEKAAAAQPDATLISFPRSGHLPWLDEPNRHAELVRAFLRRETA